MKTIIFLLNFVYLFQLINSLNKIKKCIFSSLCIQKGEEIIIEVQFNIYPRTLSNGDLIKNSNSSIFYSTIPQLPKKDKGAIYKFNPLIEGKYHFKFNHNLQCREILTVKKPIRINNMNHYLFINEEQKSKKFSFPISLIFNDSFSYNFNNEGSEDINSISVVENIDKVNIEEERFIKVKKCEIKNLSLNCLIEKENGFITKDKISNLGLYYYDRCGIRETLGFMSVNNTIENKNNLLSSFISKLYSYNMKVYQKEERMFICLVISPEKQSHKYFIEEFASKIANKYPNYIFTIVDWDNYKFITNHFQLKDNGYVQLVINDFSNDNLYIGEIKNNNEFEKIIYKLNNDNLQWTSQTITQKILKLLHLKLNREEQNYYYRIFAIISFGLLLILRYYLYSKKKIKSTDKFMFNPNKKKD